MIAKEKPILFSGAMVRSLLEGRKTQTRRIIKPQYACKTVSWGCISGQGFGFIFTGHDTVVKCPYGKIGDRLWVRETWATDLHNEQDSPETIRRKCIEAGYTEVSPKHPAGPLWYQADGTFRQWGDFHDVQGRWRPSIHMPRWASRLTLEITEVRVERLNNISEEDAIAEGAQCAGVPASLSNVGAYAKLWESINGAGSWAENPWVWVVEFKTCKA